MFDGSYEYIARAPATCERTDRLRGDVLEHKVDWFNIHILDVAGNPLATILVRNPDETVSTAADALLSHTMNGGNALSLPEQAQQIRHNR